MPNPLDAPMNAEPFAGGGGLTSANPFAELNSLMEFQTRANANRLFQTQFMANQAFGEMMAQAPDLQSGLEAATKNPLVMGFATQSLMNAKTAYLTGLQASGELGKQAQTGLEAAIKAGMTAGMQSPEMFLPIALARLETAPPSVRAQDTLALKHVAEALQAKVGSIQMQQGETPESFQNRQREAYKSGFVGLMGMGGVSPEQVNEMFPTYGIQSVNGVATPVKTFPGYMGQAPQLAGQGGETPGLGAMPGRFAPRGQQDLSPGQAGPGFQPITMPENPKSGDGTPLFHPDTQFNPGVQAPYAGLGQQHIFAPGVQESGTDLAKDFNSQRAIGRFEAAQNSNGMLAQVDQEISSLAKRGGILTPGSAGNLRGELDQLFQTSQRLFGHAPEMNAEQAVASWTALQKYTKVLGMQLINSQFGQAREAAQTIQLGVSSVPGMDNTPMGAMLLSAGLKAMNQRIIDERNFINEWRRQPYTQGNITGALEEFNREHPAEGYAHSAMDSVGMGPDGKFKGGPDQIKDLYQKGYFGPTDPGNPTSKETIRTVDKVLHEQFPDFHKGINK